MLEASEASAKAYALSDTQLRCAFPKGVRLVDNVHGQGVAIVKASGLIAPRDANDMFQRICGGLGNMLDKLEKVVVQEHKLLTISVKEACDFDVALRHVVLGSIPFGVRIDFERRALLALLA